MSENNLNHEQSEIIRHTIQNGIFCGGSPDMDILCDKGFMVFVGRKSFVPDPYYRLTTAGREAIRESNELSKRIYSKFLMRGE